VGGVVRVAAPARLHLGFLDPSASLGRRFGSLGLVINGPRTVIELGRADTAGSDVLTAAASIPSALAAAELERARAHLAALRRAASAPGSLPATALAPVHLHLAEALPAHAGLGSGTQLGLAVARAWSELHGLGLSTLELARLTGRGLRSGVGIAGFDQGGLLLDGGPSPSGPAPLLSRLQTPPDWRVLLVLDPQHQGLSGADEKTAIAQLAPLPRQAAAEVCHEVLMRVLAGAADADFAAFAAGLNRVQQVLGEHFAPAQGGSAYSSAPVRRLIEGLAAGSDCAVGQSSWGPTGFAVYPSQALAQAGLAAAHQAGLVDARLLTPIVSARPRGADITHLAPAANPAVMTGPAGVSLGLAAAGSALAGPGWLGRAA
jgi:beta-RFAP synthase